MPSADETTYHIYAKDTCLYNCLSEEEFEVKWTELKAMVGLMKTDYSEEDLIYVKCPADKKRGCNSYDDNLEPSY